ncbi:myomesin-3 [Microcaecilia unicolor]|uniref:Myomesin-3 n=1 Tax=Microcaecilia unicolor TaxID=1415580 RepID=A0A6P7ZDD2_9AMPH|nr:myomesin-3 [Microcaecilia unicolor]XP_030074496.1 myomesin-3 [Microcaecilia unicolor]
MATRHEAYHREEEMSADQVKHSLQVASSTSKRKFKTSDEEAASVEVSSVDLTIQKAAFALDTQLKSPWEIKLRREAMLLEMESRGQKTAAFGNEWEKVEKELIRTSRIFRLKMDRKALRRKVEEKLQQEKEVRELCAARAPMFWIPLRAHGVWERMNVTLSCTIRGSPPPHAQWYKNGVPINLRFAEPGKYRIHNNFGILTLEICRCTMDDSADYSVVISNKYGQATSFANVLVRSYYGLLTGLGSDALTIGLSRREAEFVSVLKPVFSRETEPFTLACTFSSDLLEHQKDVSWFRDGVLLKETDRRKMKTLGREASLTVSSAFKDDEGFYTIRIPTLDGSKKQSAYVFVRDAAAAVVGAPGAPLSVKCRDVNKDSLLLSWTPPSDDRGSPIFGYYIERRDTETDEWVPCNESPVKICRFPVSGLVEGKTYQFRVTAVNQAGPSHPSKPSNPVTMKDPAESNRTMVIPYDDFKQIVISKDDLEGNIKIPLPPTNVHAAEVSEDYLVIAWNEPDPRGREPVSYYVEKSIAGTDSWQRVNLEAAVDSPRCAVFDLVKGTPYCFRVLSVNKYGISTPSLPSEPISAVNTLVPPPPPEHVVAYRDTKTSAVVEWDKKDDDHELLGYYIYCRESGETEWQTVNNKPVTDNRFTVPELQTGKEYVFCVKAVNEAGVGPQSPESAPLVVNEAVYCPSAPYDFALLNCGKTEMVICWKAPKFTAGKAILGYFVDQHDSSETEWLSVNLKPNPQRVCKVSNLTEGHFYQFQARALNVAGLGKKSEPSELFKCEEWTMPQPGPPYDVRFTEVRDSTLMLHWEPPLYIGASPVKGYYIEMCEEGSDEWKTVNKQPTATTHMRVSELEKGKSYVFRVKAVNAAGTGAPSVPSDPVIAETKPGMNEIEVGVDEEGFIYLAFENPEPLDDPEFIWSKDYEGPPDADRTEIHNDGNKTKLILTKPSEEDLGTYSVEVPNADGVSASRTLTAEELRDLLKRSHEIRNPLIQLISGWNIEVLEMGDVRLWLQVEKLSPAAELLLTLNDEELSDTPTRKINFDRANGLIEIVIQGFSEKDRGTYTANLKDGKAKNQFSLNLDGDKFNEVLAEMERKRRDWERKQGPHFVEYLQWTVTEECHVLLKCKVANTRNETTFKWFFNRQPFPKGQYDPETGDGTLLIKKFTEENKGLYKTVVSDIRGEDTSELNLSKEVFEDILKELSRIGALSASPLKLQSTAEGFKIYSIVKYFTDYMTPSWYHKDRKLAITERLKSGSTMNQVWLQILNPTEGDKGIYTLELFDGKEIHKRSMDLSGKVFDDAMAEYQRLKEASIAEKNRAKVVRGLPDVATIMEDKTLCLTCHIGGDPIPEVTWLKNDREVIFKERYKLEVKGTVVTMTIEKVCGDDSGRYGIFVKNKYGSETGQVTLSVFKHGEEPSELRRKSESRYSSPTEA